MPVAKIIWVDDEIESLQSQKMFLEIQKKHKSLSGIIKFADLKSYDLERFEAEKRIEEKRKSAK